MRRLNSLEFFADCVTIKFVRQEGQRSVGGGGGVIQKRKLISIHKCSFWKGVEGCKTPNNFADGALVVDSEGSQG